MTMRCQNCGDDVDSYAGMLAFILGVIVGAVFVFSALNLFHWMRGLIFS